MMNQKKYNLIIYNKIYKKTKQTNIMLHDVGKNRHQLELTQQKSNKQGWQIVCVDYAKTHEHVKNDYAKTHGLAIAKVSQYLKGDNYENIFSKARTM